MPPFQALPPAPFPEGSPHILPASLDSCFAFRVLLMLFLLLDCFTISNFFLANFQLVLGI